MDNDEFEDGFGLNSAEDNYYAILNVNKDVSVSWINEKISSEFLFDKTAFNVARIPLHIT